ncbi:MAG: amidase [Candidatus Lokiarchaeota archaeon]|nr:amidase [Candidatus Lokiarchaeota archaeon]
MNKEEICYMSAYEMVNAIKNQEITSEEITEVIIERIEKINPIINAYCTTTFEMAREMAKRADKRVKNGANIGILNGVPTSIKDLMVVEGVRTTYGSKIYENNVATEDSIVVKRLKDAGCVILGKTNTPEFGHKGVTDNLIFGPTLNPWNLERTSGGSSGGAAASVVTGMGPLAQGSDGGGSIRHPACFCGVYGIKPTFGRVPRYPRLFISAQDCSATGPLVNHISDAALMLDAIKGPFEGDRFSLPADNIKYIEHYNEIPNKLRIGYSFDLGFAKIVQNDIKESVLKAIEKFSQFDWVTEKVKIKRTRVSEAFSINWLVTFAYELQPFLEKWKDKMDPNLVKWVEAGLSYPASSLPSSMMTREKFYRVLHSTFQNYDVLITPTTAVTAFECGIAAPTIIEGKGVSPTGWQAFTFPFNFTGHPAASIPCGFDRDGLPIGMQIVGKLHDELTVLQVSKAFEELAPWQNRRPILN